MAQKRNKPSWNAVVCLATLNYGTVGNSNLGGVYQIKNTKNGRTYVGSTYMFKKRWNEHLRDLRKGIHHNPFLQNDFNKSGEASYEFSVIEVVPGTKQNRTDAEQRHLDALWEMLDSDHRYNASRKAIVAEPPAPRFSTGKYNKNIFWLVSPLGIDYGIHHLSSFCKEFGLDKGTIGQVLSGKRVSHKGWTKLVDKEITSFCFVNKKTGEEKTLRLSDIKTFAEDNSIDQSHLSKHLSGKRKSVGSWYIKNRVIFSEPHKGKNYKLVSPEGNVVKINNLKQFCKDNNLDVSRMLSLIAGQNGVWSYKGWIRYGYTHQDVKEIKTNIEKQRLKNISGRPRDIVSGRFISSISDSTPTQPGLI